MEPHEKLTMDTLPVSTVSDAAPSEPALFRECPALALYAAAGCCFLIAVVGVPFNAATIMALVKCKLKAKPASLFIVNMAISDLLLSGVHAPLTGLTLLRRGLTLGSVARRLLPFSRYVLLATSMLSMMAISISRVVLITQPVISKRVYSVRNVILMVIAIWFLAIIMLMPTYFGIYGQFGRDNITGSYTIVADSAGRSPRAIYYIFTFLTSFATLAICYIRLFYEVRGSSRRSKRNTATRDRSWPTRPNGAQAIRAPVPLSGETTSSAVQQPSADTSPADQETESGEGSTSSSSSASVFRNLIATLNNIQLSKKDRKLIIMITAILCSVWICYLPMTLVKIFENDVPVIFFVVGYVLVYLSCCVNPLVYMVLSHEHRDAYRGLFSGRAALTRGGRR